MLPSQEGGRILSWLLLLYMIVSLCQDSLPTAQCHVSGDSEQSGILNLEVDLTGYAWLKKWLSLGQSWDLRAQPPTSSICTVLMGHLIPEHILCPTLHPLPYTMRRPLEPDCDESFVQSPALEGLWLPSSQLEFFFFPSCSS